MAMPPVSVLSGRPEHLRCYSTLLEWYGYQFEWVAHEHVDHSIASNVRLAWSVRQGRVLWQGALTPDRLASLERCGAYRLHAQLGHALRLFKATIKVTRKPASASFECIVAGPTLIQMALVSSGARAFPDDVNVFSDSVAFRVPAADCREAAVLLTSLGLSLRCREWLTRPDRFGGAVQPYIHALDCRTRGARVYAQSGVGIDCDSQQPHYWIHLQSEESLHVLTWLAKRRTEANKGLLREVERALIGRGLVPIDIYLPEGEIPKSCQV
jgi:hypothetical protein